MTTKLENFIKRNRRRNSHLYAPGLSQGDDFVVCPVSLERLSMIKSSYIQKILGMTVDEYDQKYPGIQKICNSRKKNISAGLQTIDPVSGLTRYQFSQTKARQTLKQTDASGMSGYKKKGQKTRATHMSKIDEFGRNGYSQLASKAILKGNLTKEIKGLILPSSQRSEYYRYKSVVTYLTEKHRKTITVGYKTGLAGTNGAYHIDHKYSISQGYKNKVSPLLIANINNLEMIPWKTNLVKHSDASITLDELFLSTHYTLENSEMEFKKIMTIIHEDIMNQTPISGANILERFNASALCRK